ncbi:hypothetical protein WMF20_23650 [Sorangium sp. So ce834]|uniref:hypothetical protein n=1 Tax=Sorangium sp. So ce834 TaxID=3133321 RepID=UPI003F605F66
MRYSYASAALCVGIMSSCCAFEEGVGSCEDCGESASALSAAALGFEALTA